MTNQTITESAKEQMKLADDLRREGKNTESERCFTKAFQLFMDEGMEDEAAGALVQLADVTKRLGRIEQSAELYKQSADIFEKLEKDVATLTSLRAALNIYKKLAMKEKVVSLKERINKIHAKQQSIKIEKKAVERAIKETNESLKRGIITRDYFDKMQESLSEFLIEIDNKIKNFVGAEGERKAPPSYIILELQRRISELSVKTASLETELNRYKLEKETPSRARFVFLKVLSSILLFASGFVLVLYCNISFPLSLESFLTLVALIFSVLAFIVAAIWKV